MSVLSVFPRRHLRACLSRLAVARGAQLRTSLLLSLALRDAARRPRRCFLRRRCDLRLLRHRLSPWQARHCAVCAPGAEQCLGLPVRDAPLPRAVRCLRGVCALLPQLCGRYSALRDQRAACEGNAGARGTASPPSIVIRGRRGRLKVAAKSTGASAARSLFGSRRTAVRASAPTEAVGIGNRQPPRQAGHAREASLRRSLTPATPNAPRTARGGAQFARGNGHFRTPAWLRPGEGGQAVASRAVSTGALCESRHARTRRSSAWSAPGAHSGERAARLGTAAWALATFARNRRGQRHAPRQWAARSVFLRQHCNGASEMGRSATQQSGAIGLVDTQG
ncbi:hypothetical protein ERJ75_001158100 [Trypanosoma vivax]|nr:hypothetical protein ERJ75_001158100 [Trypanosoma vivax]